MDLGWKYQANNEQIKIKHQWLSPWGTSEIHGSFLGSPGPVLMHRVNPLSKALLCTTLDSINPVLYPSINTILCVLLSMPAASARTAKMSFLYSYESEFLQKLVKDKKIHEARPLISHTGILMTFYLSIILHLQNFFHWYILQSWKLKRPQIPLRPHHFWTYTSNLTTVVNSVIKFMINGTT